MFILVFVIVARITVAFCRWWRFSFFIDVAFIFFGGDGVFLFVDVSYFVF